VLWAECGPRVSIPKCQAASLAVGLMFLLLGRVVLVLVKCDGLGVGVVFGFGLIEVWLVQCLVVLPNKSEAAMGI